MKKQVVPIVLLLAVLGGLLEGQNGPLNGSRPKYHRYKLIEIGTFGGPNSVYNVFSRIGRNDGTFVGAANLADPDPYAPNCFDSIENCFVQHGWKWQRGILTDLGALPGGLSSYTTAINAAGLIVGLSQNGEFDSFTGGPNFVATIWKPGIIQSLGTLGGSFSFAIAATDRDFVMGAAENGKIDTSGFAQLIDLGSNTSEWHAFGWNGGSMFDLGTLGGPGAFPNDMNDLGQVVGFSPTSSVPGPFGFPTIAPFLWEKGQMRNLGTLGGTIGMAGAINNQGQVIGTSDLAGDDAEHPFLWQHGSMQDLGTLGGSYGVGEWINEAGETVGYSGTAQDQELHAFLWRRGEMLDLGTVAGDNASNAFGINSQGQVAGQSWFFDGENVTASHAFIWENGSPMADLNTLVSPPSSLDLFEADFINDRGVIVARGFTASGNIHTAILIPQAEAADDDVSPRSSRQTGLSTKMQSALKARMMHRSILIHPGSRHLRGTVEGVFQ